MLYAMRLVGLAMDPFQNSPIAILKDRKITVPETAQGVDVSAGASKEEGMSGEPERTSTPHRNGSGRACVHDTHGDLEKEPEERILPIWIGETEAQAIATELLGIQTPRPLTHDLIKKIIQVMGGEIVRVVVTDLIENTFFAAIDIRLPSGTMETIDARPSDALALALRFGADIFVESRVMEKTGQGVSKDSHISSEEIQQWSDQQWEEMVKHWSNPAVTRYEQ